MYFGFALLVRRLWKDGKVTRNGCEKERENCLEGSGIGDGGVFPRKEKGRLENCL